MVVLAQSGVIVVLVPGSSLPYPYTVANGPGDVRREVPIGQATSHFVGIGYGDGCLSRGHEAPGQVACSGNYDCCGNYTSKRRMYVDFYHCHAETFYQVCGYHADFFDSAFTTGTNPQFEQIRYQTVPGQGGCSSGDCWETYLTPEGQAKRRINRFDIPLFRWGRRMPATARW